MTNSRMSVAVDGTAAADHVSTATEIETASAPHVTNGATLSSSSSQSSSSSSSSSSQTALSYQERWRSTWSDFQRALYSRNDDDFHSWIWIYRLSKGILDYVYHASGIAFLNERYNLSHLWRPVTPVMALCLIFLSLSSYFVSLRVHLVRRRWCTSIESACGWEYVHTSIVIYIGMMILYHFLRVIFESPGVALPNHNDHSSSSSSSCSTASSSRQTHSSTNTTTGSKLQQKQQEQQPHKWTAMKSQGGLLGWNATLDVNAERERVALYTQCFTLQKEQPEEDIDEELRPITTATKTHTVTTSPPPPTSFTFCQKCNIWRPPRCHHCSTCHRCVLQMDHHCPWVNNCIGYNNYRTFFLCLTFLVLGCWYGALMTAIPFYQEIQQEIVAHGWNFFLSSQYQTGMLDLPPPLTMMYLVLTGKLSPSMWIKLIYPMVSCIGLILTCFWLFHVKYILKAQTTLEDMMELTQLRNNAMMTILRQRRHGSRPSLPMTSSSLLLSSSSSRPTNSPFSTTTARITTTMNPYHQGPWRNITQILGNNWFLWFVPLQPKSIPPPYLPPSNYTKSD